MQTSPANFCRTIAFFLLLAACQPSNDTRIEEDVQKGVRLLDSTIQVSVTGGVATLSGAVKDSLTRNTVETSVKEMNGVKSVINKLTVQ